MTDKKNGRLIGKVWAPAVGAAQMTSAVRVAYAGLRSTEAILSGKDVRLINRCINDFRLARLSLSAMLLDAADKEFRITEAVIAGIEELGDDAASYIERKKRQASQLGGEAANSVIDHAVQALKAVAVSWFRGKLYEYLVPSQRAF